MSTPTQQIAIWQSIQTGLTHAQSLSENVATLLPAKRPSRSRRTPSAKEKLLSDIFEACKVLQRPEFAKLADENIATIRKQLQEEKEADEFEEGAKKLLHMAKSYKQGVKRKADSDFFDAERPNVNKLNEQLESMVKLGKKLKTAEIREKAEIESIEGYRVALNIRDAIERTEIKSATAKCSSALIYTPTTP